MSIWLTQTDLENATSPQVVIALTDDDGAGIANPAITALAIDRGEQEVMSWLVGEYGPPPVSAGVQQQLAGDNFLKYAALEYAVVYLKERRPGYLHLAEDDIKSLWKRADARMQRVMDARQRPPTVAAKPANVGGVSVDNGPRIIIDSADGTSNAGDY